MYSRRTRCTDLCCLPLIMMVVFWRRHRLFKNSASVFPPAAWMTQARWRASQTVKEEQGVGGWKIALKKYFLRMIKKKKRCNQQRSIRDPDDGNSASCIPNETRPSLPPDERLIGDVAEIIDRWDIYGSDPQIRVLYGCVWLTGAEHFRLQGA